MVTAIAPACRRRYRRTWPPDHLTAELFSPVAGVKMLHVPFKSGPAMPIDIMDGRVGMTFPGLAAGLPYIKAGRLRGLAVTTTTRSRALPGLSILAQSVFPSFESISAGTIYAPACGHGFRAVTEPPWHWVYCTRWHASAAHRRSPKWQSVEADLWPEKIGGRCGPAPVDRSVRRAFSCEQGDRSAAGRVIDRDAVLEVDAPIVRGAKRRWPRGYACSDPDARLAVLDALDGMYVTTACVLVVRYTLLAPRDPAARRFGQTI